MKVVHDANTRISVLLPVFNGQATLGQAVLSTLRAMDQDDELLILIQDAKPSSYDLEGLDDARIKFYFSNFALGIGKALNYLAEEANGEFIARMDQDDICLKSRFRKQLKFMKRYGLDIVFANAILFGNQVKPFGALPQLPYRLMPPQANLLLAMQNPFVHPTMLAKRSVLESLSFYRESLAEDYDLWLRASSRGFKLARMRSFGIFYRVHVGQFTQAPNFEIRVDQDASILESKQKLRDDVLRELGIPSSDFSEIAVIRVLRKSGLAPAIIWSPIGKAIRKVGNLMLSKRK